MPSARDLRDRVTFQRRAATSNVGGVVLTAWADLFTRRASLKPTPARRGTDEQVIAGRLTGTSIWDLWVRFDSQTVTLLATDRVVDARSGDTFNIAWGPKDMDRRRQWLLLQLVEGKSDG